MARNITRPDSSPCGSSKQEYDKKALTRNIKYPLSRHDVLQSRKIECLSSSDSESHLQSLHSQAELDRKNPGLQIYDLGNGLSQPRYVVHENGANMISPRQLTGNQWGSVRNCANLHLTRSIYDPDAQLEEQSKLILPAKKQTGYSKISSGGDKNSRTSSSKDDEIDLDLFKGDNNIFHVPLKTASRNRAPLKLEEANALSSSFKSEGGSIQPRASLQMIRSTRSVNDTHVHHRVDPHQRDRGSDIRSLCRVLKYLAVLLAGLVIGAGIHALIKCWTKDSPEK